MDNADFDFKAGYQTHTRKLRKWYVDGDLDINLNQIYVVMHYIGDPDTDYIYYEDDESFWPKKFTTRQEAEDFVKHLNTKPEPETHTYLEWRD